MSGTTKYFWETFPYAAGVVLLSALVGLGVDSLAHDQLLVIISVVLTAPTLWVASQSFTKRPISSVSAIVALCAIVVTAAIVAIVSSSDGSSTSYQISGQSQPEQPLIGSDLERFMESHGPWLGTEQSAQLRDKVGIRNLALFKSTGIVYSQLSTEFKSTSPWIKTSGGMTGIEAFQGGKSDVIIRFKGSGYTLNLTQPFMIEGDLNKVYLVTTDGIWSALVRDLKFVKADEVSDPSIPANPGLSLSFGNR